MMLRSAGKLLRRTLQRPYSFLLCKLDPAAFARSCGVTVGDNVRFIGLAPHGGAFGSEPYLIRIGNHVTITADVSFVTHDGGVWVFRELRPHINLYGPITVEDNVFIGMRSILLPGVRIGTGSIIGAGSVVVRDIPPNSVAAGVPAKVISTTAEYLEKNKARIVDRPFDEPGAKKRFLLQQFRPGNRTTTDA